MRLLSLAAWPSLCLAGTLAAQSAPPPRQLGGDKTVVSTATFRAVSQIRALSDGRVLVHDAPRHLVLMLDSSLTTPVVVIDSLPGHDNYYGTRTGGLLSYLGDSTLYFDASGPVFLVITPAGTVSRVRSVPLSNPGVLNFTSSSVKPPVFDAARGIVYSGQGWRATPAERPPEGSPDIQKVIDDSVRLLAVSLKTRKVDTVARIRVGPTVVRLSSSGDQGGNNGNGAPAGVLPRVDDWALTSDGKLAVLRGRDYHVDWIAVDGKHTTSPPLPYTWHRLNPLERAMLTDSVNAARDKETAKLHTEYAKDMADAAARGRSIDPEDVPFYPERFFATEVPDTMPPFAKGALRADGDGNLWIRTNQPGMKVSDPAVYDVVNQSGALIDRVQIPAGRTIVGFARNTVYFSVTAPSGFKLERVRIR